MRSDEFPVQRLPSGSPVTLRFFSKLLFADGDCWLWRGSRNKHGYGQFPALGENKAHRVSWKLFNGGIPDGQKVLHKCDVPRCVNPEHLFLGTQADNVRDMVAKGRNKSIPLHGERNPMSRLSADDVRKMRAIRSETGRSAKSIAEQFGVSTMTAHRAINNISWRHI